MQDCKMLQAFNKITQQDLEEALKNWESLFATCKNIFSIYVDTVLQKDNLT
jgi:hypothetical protein